MCMNAFPCVSLVIVAIRRGHQNPLELDLQMVVSLHVGPGNRTQPSGRAADALNLRVISPAQDSKVPSFCCLPKPDLVVGSRKLWWSRCTGGLRAAGCSRGGWKSEWEEEVVQEDPHPGRGCA